MPPDDQLRALPHTPRPISQSSDMTPSSDVASPEPSDAAARVFAIPELLEQILLCLADITVENEATKDESEGLQPHKCLAAVQRVDRTFHATTKGSQKLRRLMEGPLLFEHPEGRVETLKRTLVMNGTIQLTALFEKTIVEMDYVTNADSAFMEKFNSDHKLESWRKVRVIDSANAAVRIAFGTLVDGEYESLSRAHYEFGCHATLGELFDLWYRREQRRANGQVANENYMRRRLFGA